MPHAEVLVLGAGLAGLAAARKLRRTHQVVVLEARDRCGGRVHTDRSLGVPVELGATWVHGPHRNPITRQLEKRGLALLPEDEALERTYLEGQRVEPDPWEEWEREARRMRKRWKKARKRADTSLASLLPGEMSAGQRLAAYLVADDYGEDLDRLGVHAWDQDEAYEGPDCFVPEGLDRLIDALATGLDVRHGVVVEEVSSEGVVRTAQGTWSADTVICTLPLGVLQRLSILGLPKRVRTAIGALSPGRFHTEVLLYPDGALPVAQTLYDASEATLVFLHTGVTGASIAVGHTVGARAAELESTGRPALHAHLEHLLGPLPDPLATLRSSWITDPFTRGAYSSCPPGVPHAVRRVFTERFASLLLAGEHTSVDYPGTMHGAWHSGRRAAKQVLRMA